MFYLCQTVYGCKPAGIEETKYVHIEELVQRKYGMPYEDWWPKNKYWYCRGYGRNDSRIIALMKDVIEELEGSTPNRELPCVFITETSTFWGTWNHAWRCHFVCRKCVCRRISRTASSFSLMSNVRNRIPVGAFGLIDAALCTLYAHAVPNAISIVFEAYFDVFDLAIDVSCWKNYEYVDSLGVVRSFHHHLVPPTADALHQLADEAAQKVHELQFSYKMPLTVMFTVKSAPIAEYYTPLVSLLLLRLKKFEVIQCSEIDVLQGAITFTGMPSFYSNMYYKTELYEQAYESDQKYLNSL